MCIKHYTGDHYTLGNTSHTRRMQVVLFTIMELRLLVLDIDRTLLFGGGIDDPHSTELEYLLDKLEKDTANPPGEWRERVAEEIAKLFSVQPDEVAILGLLPAGKSLEFVLPQKLRAVGTIPLSSTTALAARTARERRADMVNNFATSRHASVFEGVPLGGREARSIQKIISAPILRGDTVVGVAQISRKGPSALNAGADFNSRDLSELQGLNRLLGRILRSTTLRELPAKPIDAPCGANLRRGIIAQNPRKALTALASC